MYLLRSGFWPDHCNTSNLSLLSLSGCRFTGVLGIIVLLHNSVLAKLYQTDKWPWISLVCRGVHSHLNNWNWLKKQAQMVTSPPPCLTVVGVCNNIPMFVTSQTCCCTLKKQPYQLWCVCLKDIFPGVLSLQT